MDFNQIDKTASLSSNNSLSLMVFKLRSLIDEEFNSHPFLGINIFKVREVLNFSEFKIHSMPSVDSEDQKHSLIGMVNVRGEYIPVYSLSHWIGYPDFEYETSRSVIIVSEINGTKLGIHVAYIHGVFEKNWDELKTASTNMGNGKIISETEIDNELCMIVDIEEMISDIKGQDLQEEVEKLENNDEFHTDKSIAFADDSKAIRVYVKSLLDNLHIKSHIFDDGEGLLNFMASNPEDVGLVLTDLEMPNVSGHTVIKTLKEKGFKQPIIVHSSMTTSDSQRQANELGADDFIGKIDSDKIVEKIKQYLG